MSEDGNEILTGFGMLKDMTKEELINEILASQKIVLEKMEVTQLRCNVIELRVISYKHRLAEEAGVTPTLFGYTEKDTENE